MSCSLYNIWHSMRERCLCSTYRDYKYYGGRGVTIDAEWSDYAVFRKWALATGFGKGMTLDRRDPNGNYTDDNCRWVPKSDQQLNTRRVKQLTVCGITKPLPVWGRMHGLTSFTIRCRLKNGWSHEHAVLIPLGGRRPAEVLRRPGRKPRIAV